MNILDVHWFNKRVASSVIFFVCVCVLCKQGIYKLAVRNRCSHVVQTYTWSVYNRVAQISALLQTEPQMNSGDNFFDERRY